MGITKNRQTTDTIMKMAKTAFPQKDVSTITELTEGMCNAAYEVLFQDGFSSVLKIAAAEHKGNLTNEVELMEAEVRAMRLVGENTSVRIPKVYYYDTSREICSGDYFFMEKLEGKSWSSIKMELDESINRSLAKEVGKISKELSSVTNPEFGLMGDDNHRFTKLYDFLFFLIKNVLEDAEKKNVFIGVSKEEILKKLSGDQDIFQAVTHATLVHWDMWEGNIFVKEGRLEGIIDWERAMWGEPYMDDRFRNHNDNPDFLEGFGKTQFTEEEKRRMTWYDVYLYLVMMTEVTYREYEDDGQYRWVKPLFEEAWSKL